MEGRPQRQWEGVGIFLGSHSKVFEHGTDVIWVMKEDCRRQRGCCAPEEALVLMWVIYLPNDE